ncbi:hypothetical protein PT974_07752 [Cladobotryum mycophilum]|uniref:GST C-terminal domain-containing protein n=1 Tax=Cladobotryum mycophilum TaxID=491253 RepID=A0ABR0SHT1_9HYPO
MPDLFMNPEVFAGAWVPKELREASGCSPEESNSTDSNRPLASVEPILESEYNNVLKWESRQLTDENGMPIDRTKSDRMRLASMLDGFEETLSTQPFLGGEKIGLKDIFFIPHCNILLMFDVKEEFISRPNVLAWWVRLSQLSLSRSDIQQAWQFGEYVKGLEFDMQAVKEFPGLEELTWYGSY